MGKGCVWGWRVGRGGCASCRAGVGSLPGEVGTAQVQVPCSVLLASGPLPSMTVWSVAEADEPTDS